MVNVPSGLPFDLGMPQGKLMLVLAESERDLLPERMPKSGSLARP